MPEAPLTLIHRNKGPNPVSMRVSGQFATVEEACNEAGERALRGPFDPDTVQLFGDPFPALCYAAATLDGRGVLLAVVPIPAEVCKAAGLPVDAGLGAWAVGLPHSVIGAFDEILANGVQVAGGGGDDLAKH